MKKLLYIGHGYHNKTKSTQFLQEMFRTRYDVETFDYDPAIDSDDVYKEIMGKHYEVLVLFQIVPPISIIRKIFFKHGVIFPMYDSARLLDNTDWLDYKEFNFINFSFALHSKLLHRGFSSYYIQYFPEPRNVTSWGNKSSIFFWQRTNTIDFNVVSKLFDVKLLNHVHFHRAIDPGHTVTQSPSDLSEKIFFSDWYDNKEDLLQEIEKAALYIAPRDYEGIGLSFLEAMAMGRCVIAPNHPTMNEYITQNKTGVLYNLDNPLEICIENAYEIQKNTYEYMKQGYKAWEADKYKILDWLIEVPKHSLHLLENLELERIKLNKDIIMQEVTPKVTVITIVYNLIDNGRKDTFLQCVASVREQTYSNIEHIIIDGASTDGTLELILSTGLEYYSEPDTGLYDAMNKGIARASGKYIAFLHSDDFWHGKSGVEDSVRALESARADFSYAESIFINEENRFLGVVKPVIGSFFLRMPFCHQTMFTKTEVFRKLNCFDASFRSAGDYDFILRLCLSGAKPVEVQTCFTTFRTGGFSEDMNLSWEECARCLKKNYSEFASAPKDFMHYFKNAEIPKEIFDAIILKVHPELAEYTKGSIFARNNLITLTQYTRIDNGEPLEKRLKQVYSLFGLPILKIKQDGEKKRYILLGIPLLKVMKSEHKELYYLLGFLQIVKREKYKNRRTITLLGFIKFRYQKRSKIKEVLPNEKMSVQHFERILLSNGKILVNQQSFMNSRKISDYEFKVFSQFGDDGIIQYLIKNIHIENEIFIEFGVENYLESNTRFLMMNNNWRGFIMDGSEEAIQSLKSRDWFWKYNLTAKAVFLDKENVNALLAETGFQNIGLLHIDLDGNDYWIFENLDLSKLNPSIIILEYNSVFGKERAITVPYDEKFYRTEKHFSNLYFGASLKALELVAKTKGYSLVCSNLAGNNAYFVRNDLLNEKIKATTSDEVYVCSQFRESRNEKGELSYLKGKERLQAIHGLPVIDVETMKTNYLPIHSYKIHTIELTNACMMKCVMCPRTHSMTREIGFMDMEIFKKIIDQQIDNPKAADEEIWLHHFGESLLHENFDEAISYMSERGLKPALSLNPFALTENKAVRLFKAKPYLLYFSIDGFDDESFYETRGIKNAFEATMRNTLEALEIHKALSPQTLVKISIIDFPTKQAEIQKIKDIFAFLNKKEYPNVELQLKEFCDFSGDTQAITELGIKKQTVKPCHKPWSYISFVWNGDAVPCCYDYDTHYKLGNVTEKSILEIFNDEPMNQLRTEIASGEVKNLLCKNCQETWHK